MKIKVPLLRVAALVGAIGMVFMLAAGRGGHLLAAVRPVVSGSGGASIHILAIGIDRYEARSFSLRFAKADATSFAAALARTGTGTYQRVFQHVLLDEAATTESILETFYELRAIVRPQDTFVFFFAGMAFTAAEIPTTQQEAYLALPRPNDNLSGTALKSLLRQIQARNKLVVIDSCYGDVFFQEAGAAFAIEAGRDTARATRANTLTIGTSGVAMEDPSLGHGVLTAVILEGLDGEADLDRNKAISARELETFSGYRALQQAGRRGWKQDVQSSAVGEDFLVGKVGRRDADTIPPSLFLEEPSALAASRPRTLLVNGRVTDASGISEVTLNGTSVTVAPGGFFSAVVTPLPELSSLEIVAVDRAKNATGRIVSIQGLSQASRGDATFGDPSRGTVAEPGYPGLVTETPRRDYALLIASDQYDYWSPLSNPIFDAQTIATHLESTYGFEVELLRNPQRADILESLIGYQNKKYKKYDQLLIFFAGHGLYDRRWDDGFIVARDSPSVLDIMNGDLFVQHGPILRMVNQIPAEHILLVLDVCFGGALFDAAPVSVHTRLGERSRTFAFAPPSLRPPMLGLWPSAGVTLLPSRIEPWTRTQPYEPASDDELVRRKLKQRTRRILTSGSTEYVPDGVPGHHSPFAANFIAALESRGEDGFLTLDELYGFLERVRPEPRRGRFTPDAPGDFVLVVK